MTIAILLASNVISGVTAPPPVIPPASTFSQTARDVVTGAMRDLGILALGRDPKARELSYGIEQLNLLLKELAAEGLTPWTEMDGSVVFNAGSAQATLLPRPVAVSQAEIEMANGYYRQLFEMGAERFPNRNQQGMPVGYELRYTPNAVKMRLWPVPRAKMTVTYRYSRVIGDVNANDPLDVPQMWGSALREMLKARLTAFGPVSPDVEMRAMMMKERLLDFNRPESYYIGPAW